MFLLWQRWTEGASIVIDEEIEAKDIKTENTNLVVVKEKKIRQ